MRLLSFLLLLLYFTVMVRPFAPYVEFALHQKEIAATQCENRNRPEMHCNGRCYLMKRIQASQAQQELPALPSAQKTADSLPIHEALTPTFFTERLHFTANVAYTLENERVSETDYTLETVEPPRG
jgi:hypothetical protein